MVPNSGVAVKAENVNSDSKLRVPCTLCTLKFETFGERQKHLRDYHRVDCNGNNPGTSRSGGSQGTKSELPIASVKTQCGKVKRERKPKVVKKLKEATKTCGFCGSSMTKSDLSRHLKVVHNQSFTPRWRAPHAYPKHECSFCFERFFTYSAHEWHFKERHEPWLWGDFVAEASRSIALKKQPTCPDCGEQRFPHWGAVQDHMVNFHDHAPREEFLEEHIEFPEDTEIEDVELPPSDENDGEVEFVCVKRRCPRPSLAANGEVESGNEPVIDVEDSDAEEEDGGTSSNRPTSATSSDSPLLLDEDEEEESICVTECNSV